MTVVLHQLPLCGLALLLLSSCTTETVRTRVDSGKEDFIGQLDPKASEQAYLKKIDESLGLNKGYMNSSNPFPSGKRSAYDGNQFTASGDTGFGGRGFNRKDFDASGKQFATANWNDRKSYNQGKMDTPEFINSAKGVNGKQSDLNDKSYDGTKASDMAKTWMNSGDKPIEHKMDSYLREKSDTLSKPQIVNSSQHQQKTIEEVRSIMGRNDEGN